MEITEVTRRAYILGFVYEKFEEMGFDMELIHGLRHLQNVQNEFYVLQGLCPKIDSRVLRLLKIAIDVHDLGRIFPGDHAEISAKLFAQMPIEDLSNEEKRTIIFAVKNHSRGLGALSIDRAERTEERVLGLLGLCDHADSASPEGYVRALLWRRDHERFPIRSSFSIDRLRKLMKEGCSVEERAMYKSESLVAHLVCNFFATGDILKRVQHILSEEYIERVRVRQIMFEEIIELLLEL